MNKPDYQITIAWHAIQPTTQECSFCKTEVLCDTLRQNGVVAGRALTRYHALGFCAVCSRKVDLRWEELEQETPTK